MTAGRLIGPQPSSNGSAAGAGPCRGLRATRGGSELEGAGYPVGVARMASAFVPSSPAAGTLSEIRSTHNGRAKVDKEQGKVGLRGAMLALILATPTAAAQDVAVPPARVSGVIADALTGVPQVQAVFCAGVPRKPSGYAVCVRTDEE